MIDKAANAMKVAEMFRQSRADSGVSQDFVARSLGVSKRTVQNWEAGFASPTIVTGLEWFQVVKLPPMPYYWRLTYPCGETEDQEALDSALYAAIRSLPEHHKKELLYWFTGAHGSPPLAVLEMVTAHLQTPLRNRLSTSTSTALNYEIARSKGCIVDPSSVQPDMDILNAANTAAYESILDDNNSYTITKNKG